MSYFTEIPRVVYPNLEDTTATNFVELTNILTRSAFLKSIIENSALFYEYSVRDGETAEIVADKLYGDVNHAWIVLLFNNLMNPFYDFPLIQEQLHEMIEAKYNQTIEQSKTTIHHYEERIRRTVYYLDMPQTVKDEKYVISAEYQNPNTGIVETRPSLPGTADTSIVGPSYTEDFGNGVKVKVETSYHAISNYTYEQDENETRRNIKLLDPAYVGVVQNEFRRLMRDGR